MQKISEISTLFDANQDARNSTHYYILYREGRKQSFVSMSSGRQTKYGRSSYRLGREQIMLAKRKAKLRQHKQRMIIYKNIEEQLIGGCSASTMI